MASLARELAPMVLFYLLGAAAILYGVTNHPELMFRDPPVSAPRFSEQPSDTVPNNISCQMRGAEMCQPTRFSI